MDYQTAADYLREQDNILILTHRRPDGDTLGCGAALCLALRALGKTAHLLPNQEAHGLFTPYLEGVTAPDGFQPDFVVAVDTSTQGLLPANAAPYRDKIDLALDHHASHEPYAKETCLYPDCAACGELLFWIIWDWQVLDERMAMLLYMAIATDTGCFVYSNTTPETHRIVAALMETGFDCQWVNKRHFRTKTKKRLQLESMIVRDMELHDGDTIAIAAVTLDMMASLEATEEDAEDISAFVGQLEGVRYAVTLRELAPGQCKLSLRTDASLNASTVCGLFGGGGHPAASGCTIHAPVAEAKAKMLAGIRQVLHG